MNIYLPKTIANFGTDVSDCSTYEEVVYDSKLDYPVEKSRLITEHGHVLTNLFGIIRLDTNSLFSTCTDKYKLVKHEDAFKCLNTITEYGFMFCRSGEIVSGTSLIILRKKDSILVGSNYCYFFLMLSNSYNGKDKISLKMVPVVNGIMLPSTEPMYHQFKHFTDIDTSDNSKAISEGLQQVANFYGQDINKFNNCLCSDIDFIIYFALISYGEEVILPIIGIFNHHVDELTDTIYDEYNINPVFIERVKKAYEVHKSIFTTMTKFTLLYMACRQFDKYYVEVDNNKHLSRLFKENKTNYLSLLNRL